MSEFPLIPDHIIEKRIRNDGSFAVKELAEQQRRLIAYVESGARQSQRIIEEQRRTIETLERVIDYLTRTTYPVEAKPDDTSAAPN